MLGEVCMPGLGQQEAESPHSHQMGSLPDRELAGGWATFLLGPVVFEDRHRPVSTQHNSGEGPGRRPLSAGSSQLSSRLQGTEFLWGAA